MTSCFRFDDKLNRSGGSGGGSSGAGRPNELGAVPEHQLARSTQFGITLKFINANSPCLNYIPPVVRKCVDSMSLTGVIDTEGIFRRTGSYAAIGQLKKQVNAGEMEEIDFKAIDTHVLAGLLKAFLRDLTEPMLTFELYEEIVAFRGGFRGCVRNRYLIIIRLVSHRLDRRRTFAQRETTSTRTFARRKLRTVQVSGRIPRQSHGVQRPEQNDRL